MDHDVILLLSVAALGLASSTVGGFLLAIMTAGSWARLRGIK